ncbi:hypothetical protein [Methylophaga sp.]|uniref:hypothetical protein n=1 Tax=Methylophaga sp. TaxID=2024840 RepID=UPI003F6EB1DE
MRIEHLKWVLVDLIVDLATTSKLFREIKSREGFDPFSNQYHLGLCRLCNSSAIIALSRLWEALDGYNKEIKDFPAELFQRARSIKQEIEKKKVYQFRSKYTAHLFDKDTKEPLNLEEGYRRLTEIVGNDMVELEEFYEWLCPENIDEAPCDSVAAVVTDLRDYCSELIGHAERP